MSAALRPSRVEIDLGAVRHNARELLRRADGAALCAVVKADGYGHGAAPVARAALDAGAAWLAVALVEEGEALRAAGIAAPILLLSEPPAAGASRVLAADLTPVVYTGGFAAALDEAAATAGRDVAVHLKADTGMSRVGQPPDGWDDLFAAVGACPRLRVSGLMTHLARADEPEAPTTGEQLDRFDAFLRRAERAGVRAEVVHAANSAATIAHARARHDLVRAGIALYGLSPAAAMDADQYGLRPVARLVTEVAFAKRVAAGTPASYGHTWSAPADGWLATLPIGYADGAPRRLSNAAEVLVRGVRRPIVGNVCMDQILVWCGDDAVVPGEEVVLIGDQGGARITADEWAAAVGTITYEIATGWSARLPRVVHDGGT